MPGPLDLLMPGGMPGGGAGAPGSSAPDAAGGPGGGLDGILRMLTEAQQSPSPSAEDQMLHQASLMINAAYARVAPRSAKAARALSQANVQIQSAREALQSEASRPMAPPPSLGMPAMGGM